MKHSLSQPKVDHHTASNALQHVAASSQGMALAPPAYGVDVIDSPVDKALPESGQVLPKDASLAMKSVASSADDDAGTGVTNQTGLPAPLKAGIEQLSGLAMDSVRVHYNSAKPAALQALAYTQGTEIYVGPGQERHLPHEGWHIVQQLQGRVRPTGQAQGLPLNEDGALEQEADVMGAKAALAAPSPGKRMNATATQAEFSGAPNEKVRLPFLATRSERQPAGVVQGMFVVVLAIAAVLATEASGYGFTEGLVPNYLRSIGRTTADIQTLWQHVSIVTALRLARIQGRALPYLTVLAQAIAGGAPTDRIIGMADPNLGVQLPQQVVALANSPADITQIQRIGGNNAAALLQLYADGATALEITVLLGHHANGTVLHNQIQTIANHAVAHLIQLYADGATAAQITTLLGHHADGPTLHNQIQAIANNDVADLIQLYVDGATAVQITTLLGHHADGPTLHNQIQAIANHTVAHLIRLYVDGATAVEITALLGHHANGNVLHNQIQAIANHDVADLIQLYVDGATAVQITALLGHHTNGTVLHNQIQAIANHDVADLIQLYVDGATAVQITALLGHHADGPTLHNQIQAIANHDVADLIQLYVDGATAVQITALLGHHADGPTLHNQIQAIANHTVAHLIRLYGDGATAVQITTLLGHHASGTVLHNQIQAIANNDVAHLIQLYADGATAAQITALLGHHTNGTVLHNQIQAIANHTVAHLIQLYADGATAVQITTLLGHQANGTILHNQIQAIANNDVAHLIRLYVDGATPLQITTLLAHNDDGDQLHREIQRVINRGLTIADLVTICGMFTRQQVWDVMRRNPPLTVLNVLLNGNIRNLQNVNTWINWVGSVRVYIQYNNQEQGNEWGIGLNIYLRYLNITWYWHAHYTRNNGQPIAVANQNGSHFKTGHARTAPQLLGGSPAGAALTLLQWAAAQNGGSLNYVNGSVQIL